MLYKDFSYTVYENVYEKSLMLYNSISLFYFFSPAGLEPETPCMHAY